MEKKINIAELLKDCPQGMELDCTMYEDCKFLDVDPTKDSYLIRITTPCGIKYLDKYGCYTIDKKAKCVIFPKGKTTWEGFHRPFKDGDVLFIDCADDVSSGDLYKYIFILKKIDSFGYYSSYCHLSIDGFFFIANCIADNRYTPRFATEEEKQKLFDAIKANGYKWNTETKTLEKLFEPKFKVGDVIQDKDSYTVRITEVNKEDECYEYESAIAKGIGCIAFSHEDEWELVPNKFDINTLKPFESRVLVRDSNAEKWKTNFWGFYDIDHAMNYPYECCGTSFAQCIPYEGNEHLLGTTDDCDEFYKTWEK